VSTFLQLCQRVRRDCGISQSGPTTVTGQTGILANVVDWVADAIEEIENLHADWHFLLAEHTDTCVAGQQEYSAPSDLGQWDRRAVYLDRTLNTYRKLRYMDYDTWRSNFRNGVKTNSKPTSFTIKPDDTLVLEGPPDDTYSIYADYWKKPTRPTADSDTSLIPTRWEKVIIARAKLYFAEYDAAQEILQSSTQEFARVLLLLESDQLPNRHMDSMAESDLHLQVVVE
jgi:hypothetical protein